MKRYIVRLIIILISAAIALLVAGGVYGLRLEYDFKEYKASSKKLPDPCIEDVLIQMLKDGYRLTLVDTEEDGKYTKAINAPAIFNRFPKIPIQQLADLVNERDDSVTASIVLQVIFFGEEIFS